MFLFYAVSAANAMRCDANRCCAALPSVWISHIASNGPATSEPPFESIRPAVFDPGGGVAKGCGATRVPLLVTWSCTGAVASSVQDFAGNCDLAASAPAAVIVDDFGAGAGAAVIGGVAECNCCGCW